jgi:tetratricopeptide (TPR) repeat protein
VKLWNKYGGPLLVFLLFIAGSDTYAQPQDNDTKLAAHYYGKGEFEKAEIYYEKSYKKYDAQLYFDRYYYSLFYQQKYDECEKLVEKQLKKDPYTVDNHFKLAAVYEETDRLVQANDIYKKLIHDLQPIQSRVEVLGEAFQSRAMYDYALETYLKGQKILRKGYGFQLELAAIYAVLNRPADMIAEYLNLLDYSPTYLRTVQTYLSRAVDFESDGERIELLREEILLKVQKNPDQTVYNEMFIWYYLQKKEFSGAVFQAKALDKKSNDNGRRMMEIASVCYANKAYADAVKAYDYVIEFGQLNPYYHSAVENKLGVQFEQLTLKKTFTKEQINVVVGDFETALNTMGRSKKSLGTMRQLTKIYAFYMDESVKAMALANEIMALPLTKHELAEMKILKGDIYVVQGDIWEASLLYMQVEKEFSEDVMGHEAKFKNAKVFYYDGEFDYAKAQLDVLKASTSKLIANNAMQLSLLIQDNLGIDTTQAPVQMYASADLLLAQHKYTEAIEMLDSLEKRFPFHSMVDEVLFKKAEIYEGLQKWDLAVEFYTVVLESYSHDILGDDAAFRLAEIYDYRLDNPQKAAEYYKKILFDFGGSLYTAEAREKFRSITANYN